MDEKKTEQLNPFGRRRLIEPFHPTLSISRQCHLLGLNRSTYYYEPAKETAENLALMRMIDEEYTAHPFYGRRRMTAWLQSKGQQVNPKRTRRLMQLMGLEAIYQKPNLSKKYPEHKTYPYLLKNYQINKPCQVWSADITYIRMARGFMYLTAIIDWFSRYVVAWRLSNTLDSRFCVEALLEALEIGHPEIFNTDQGVQYTSIDFINVLTDANIRISMDGKGRASDNIFVERLWRTVKYEHVYLQNYETVPELFLGLGSFFDFYNNERLHQSLGYIPPRNVHFENYNGRAKLDTK